MASAFYPCADCGTSVEVLEHDPYAVRRQADRYATKGGRCRTCFAAAKKAESDAALAAATAELADLTILPLDGSERQVAWAETIRADKLVAVRRSLSDPKRPPARTRRSTRCAAKTTHVGGSSDRAMPVPRADPAGRPHPPDGASAPT